MPRKEKLREVYVWELPVRLYHWLNALCIVVLCATGLIMANPPAVMSQVEAASRYWFGMVRFIHFVTAFLFLFNFIFRMYWGIVGNKYVRWKNFIPLNKAQWDELAEVIKVDVLMLKNKSINNIGHNQVAYCTYFIFFIACMLQCMTGFGLYAQMSKSLLPQMFAWIVPLIGGDLAVRQVHHFLMWFFMLFTVGHIYLVFYHDYTERRGIASSMIGGWKFMAAEIPKAEENLTNKAQ